VSGDNQLSHLLGENSRSFLRAIGAFLIALVGLQALLQAGLAGEVQGTLFQDDATIVATGRSALPADPIAWRVVRDTALAASDSAFKERALGFAIADQGEIELIGDGFGPTVEIAADGAGFIPEAVRQIHVSPSGQPTPYLRIGLVPPVDATYTAGAKLVYPGDGFAAPSGVRELTLVRHRLSEGSEFRPADFGVPTLLVVTQGEVVVDGDDGQVQLGESEARAFDGEPTVTATAAGETLVYVAIVGGEVGGPPAYEGTPGTGEVWVFAHGCPSDMPAPTEDLGPYIDACGEPLEGTPFILTHGDQQEYQDTQIDIAAPGQSLAVWRDVPAGPISIGSAPVAGYGPLAVFCSLGEGQNTFIPVQNLGFTLHEGQVLTCHFFFRPNVSGGD
jgi:hypothetical protein